MKNLYQSICICLSLLSVMIFASENTEQQNYSAEELQQIAHMQEVWQSLKPQEGIIQLSDGLAKLDVPTDYYFYNAQDAEKILVDLWGNPPNQKVLGLIMPKKYTAFDGESWAVTIDFEADGYVSDEDAEDIDYNDLLSSMKKQTRDNNKFRIENGYPEIELIGWAQAPYYDSATKKLHWAKELGFVGEDINTLNYDIRMLGRRGVLVLNFIAGMPQLEEINQSLDGVLAMADFNEGHRYQDFDSSVDKVAAYGLGALVAGKVAAKAGLWAVLLIALKKFWIFIVIGLGALFKFVTGIFRKDEKIS